jgi:hypothetical protein
MTVMFSSARARALLAVHGVGERERSVVFARPVTRRALRITRVMRGAEPSDSGGRAEREVTSVPHAQCCYARWSVQNRRTYRTMSPASSFETLSKWP